MEKIIAYCGLNCYNCPVFLATKNDDDVAREKTAAMWAEQFGFDLKPEDIKCWVWWSKNFENWIKTFINLIRQKKMKVNFTISCRIDDIDIDIIKELISIGLKRIYIGIESGIPRALKLFNKNIRIYNYFKTNSPL